MKVKRSFGQLVGLSALALLLLNPAPTAGGGVKPVGVLADVVEKICDKTYERRDFARVTEAHKDCLIDKQEKLLSGTDKLIVKLLNARENGMTVVIDGHRDKAETPGISLTRANLLRDYLVNEMGIDAQTIVTRSFGDTCPASKTNADKNRRFQIWLVPKTADGSVEDSIDSKIRPLKACPEGVKPVQDETPAVPADSSL